MEAVIQDWLRGASTPPLPLGQPNHDTRKRRRPLSGRDQNASTRSKRARKQKNGEEEYPAHQTASEENDPNHETPHDLSQSPSTLAVQLRSPGLTDRDDGPPCTTSSYGSACQASHATVDSQTSPKRERSLSPSKGLRQLTRLLYPVRHKTIGTIQDMPEALRALTRTMRSIEQGRGIITAEDANELLPLLAGEDDPGDGTGAISSARAECGSVPEREYAGMIVELTAQNVRLGRCEPAWNGNVHYPLLAEARKRSTWSKEVRCENVTTAAMNKNGTGWCGKVNYAITLALDDSVEGALLRRGVDTLSHSDYRPLCDSPPAISVKTTLDGEQSHEAGLQLSFWARAHAVNLRKLVTVYDRSLVCAATRATFATCVGREMAFQLLRDPS